MKYIKSSLAVFLIFLLTSCSAGDGYSEPDSSEDTQATNIVDTTLALSTQEETSEEDTHGLQDEHTEITTQKAKEEPVTEASSEVKRTEPTREASTQPTHEAEAASEKEADPTVSHETETKAEETTTKGEYCTILIECKTILSNMDGFNNNKSMFLPSDGVILDTVSVELSGGETVFDILKFVCANCKCSHNCEYCQKNGIFLEYSYSPAFENYYIEGIHQIYEKDCGAFSGWMYSVNGVFPSVGASSYTVSAGDSIEFRYTCDMGEDIGDFY